MAMPDDVLDDLDILQRVFPKWQGDDILNYLIKTPAENRVKHAICKYIRSHDADLNRNDCETDAKLVHEIFPEVPFAHIFKQITIFGDERNRVRICLRLLLSENGFKTKSISDLEIVSQEIKDIVKKHSNVINYVNSTLNSLNHIRNKYIHANGEAHKNKTSSDSIILSNGSTSDIVKSSNTVVLSKSPNIDIDDPKPSTSRPRTESLLEKSETDSSEIIHKATCSTNDNIVCMNPFDDNANNTNAAKKTLIDLTLKPQRRGGKPQRRGGKPYDLYHVKLDEVINLDTQDLNTDVIIEDKRIPEPIKAKKFVLRKPVLVLSEVPPDDDDDTEQTERKAEQNIEAVAGPSGVQFSKRKSKLPTSKEDCPSPKKSKMNEHIISILDTTDEELEAAFINEEIIKPNRASILMYDDLFDRKKRNSSTIVEDPEKSEETVDQVEEVYTIDNGLYFPLMEIFPDACPIYLKKLCNGKENKGSELDQLISKVLDHDDYPRRKAQDESQAAIILSTEDQLDILTQVLPQADPMYLKKQIEDCNGDPEAIKLFIIEAVELKNFPTLKEYQRKQQLSTQSKQYTSDFDVQKFLEQIPEPEKYFKGKTYEEFTYEEYDYLLGCLKNVFNVLPLKKIRDESRYSKSVSDIFDKLQHQASNDSNHLKQYRKKRQCDTVLQTIPFLQEVAFNVHKKEILDYQEDRKQRLVQQRIEHRSAGTLITCSCCFDEELLPHEVVTCDLGCVNCKNCVQKSTEVAFGEAKTTFLCISGCGTSYSLKLLQEALTKKLFSKVAQKQQLAEVRAAGLEDLEQCPFCDFANILSADDRLFRCFNPECMKESCRKCKEPNHIPLRCEELEKDADVQARTAIENRLTEALLRTCSQCKTKFIKSSGCNKMTCPKCGSFSCYICGQVVKDYKHFNGQGGDRLDLCPLFSDTNKLHEEAVLKAAEDAKKDIDPNTLKYDPTTNLEKHFEEYNRNNPVVLPPGVQQNAMAADVPFPMIQIFYGEENRPHIEQFNVDPPRHGYRRLYEPNRRLHQPHRFDANRRPHQQARLQPFQMNRGHQVNMPRWNANMEPPRDPAPFRNNMPPHRNIPNHRAEAQEARDHHHRNRQMPAQWHGYPW